MTLQLLKKVTNVLTYILIFSDTSQFKNFSLWGGRNSTIWSHNDVTVPIMLWLDVGNDENIILCYFGGRIMSVFEVIGAAAGDLRRRKHNKKRQAWIGWKAHARCQKRLYTHFLSFKDPKLLFQSRFQRKKVWINVQFARPVFFWSWSLSAYIVPHKKWFFLDFDITGWSIGHELIISLNWII